MIRDRSRDILTLARSLIEQSHDVGSDPDQMTDEQLIALAGGAPAYAEYERFFEDGTLPESPEGLQLLSGWLERMEIKQLEDIVRQASGIKGRITNEQLEAIAAERTP